MLRKFDPLEKLFFNPHSQNDIYFAIKFTEKKFVDKALENFQKFFAGTRLRVEGDHYFKVETPLEVKKLPNWIQETEKASLWAEENLVTPASERLTNFAVNDNILVLQSNHNLSDGGFLLEAIKNVLTDTSNLEPVSEPPYRLSDAFSAEIDNAIKAFAKKPYKPEFELATYKYNCNDSRLATPGTKRIQSTRVIHAHDLMCYDKKEKRPKQCSESQFAALCFAMSALCNQKPSDYNPMSISIIVDARRFMYDKSRIDWRFGQCFASPVVGANPQPGDTVKSIISKIRDSIRSKDTNYIFHDLLTLDTFLKPKPSQLYSIISSIGPIKYKKPIVDIDLRNWYKTTEGVGDNGKANGASWSFISYSKINEEKNDLILFQLHDPSECTMLTNKLLIESVEHFLTKIPLDTKYEDALNEIERFQKQIIDNY